MSTEHPEAPASPDRRHILSELQDNFEQQQAKIETLRDLVRKSETPDGSSSSSAHEKVKNITQRLTEMKSKVRSRHNLDGSFGELKHAQVPEEMQASSPIPKPRGGLADTPGNEKIQLLRRQVEESKIKMAERENSKREIEERVIQLKAKFDSTQQSLERSSELGRSMGDLSALNANSIREKIKSSADLSFAPLNLDKEKIKFLENRIKMLEKQVEKQLNVAPTADSSVVNLLRQQILDLEENLRAKQSIIEARTQAVSLVSENFNAKTATTVGNLEDTKAEMRAMQEKFVDSESELRANIEILQNELKDQTNKIRNLEEINGILETARFELTVKNSDMESKLQGVLEYSTKLDELNKLNEALQHKINNLEEQLMEKTVEYNVLNANFSVLQEKIKSTAPKSLFSKTGDEETEMEINRLKEQLDESNRSMIKIKLKCKQLQKQVDKFSKISDAHDEAIKLAEENQELQAKIDEQARETENLQFDPFDSYSTTATARELELADQIRVLEETCENQNAAIKLLEEQKLELQTINQKLDLSTKQPGSVEDAETDVAFQAESIELQKQTHGFISVIDKLSIDLEKLKHENESLRQEIRSLEEEKCDLQKKADHYIIENMELIEKVEKLSKSSSSAESIEIVERLTQQEKLEMEQLNKKISVADGDCMVITKAKDKIDELPEVFMGQELSDSLVKLREESSELMHRIELFTRERREVLEKMDVLSCENQELNKQIINLKLEKSVLGDNLTKSKIEIISLEEQLDKSLERIRHLETSLKDNLIMKEQFEDKIKCLTEPISSSSSCVPSKDVIVQWKQSLTLMQLELENYRKSADKSSRLNASKKLAKEAKNVGQQFSDFIEICLNCSHMSAATDNIEVNEFKEKCIELDSIIIQLRAELQDLKIYAAKKDTEIKELNTKLNLTVESMKKCQHDNDLEMRTMKTVQQELEAKLNVTKEEITILNALAAEQKQQLLDAYAEHEMELHSKDLSIGKYEQQIERLQLELRQWQSKDNQLDKDFRSEMKKQVKELENAISAKEKSIAEQSVELKNKQDTIEALNGQIMDLYRVMEDNSCKLVEKEDEISYLQELMDTNKAEIDALVKENETNKNVSESLLAELERHKGSSEREDKLKNSVDKIKELEEKVIKLEGINLELESKSKDQMEKLKKFAANLKRKSAQCLELEAKIQAYNNLETSFLEKEKDRGLTVSSLQDQIQNYKKEIEEASLSIKNERDSVIEKNKCLCGEIAKMHNEIGHYKNKVKYFENSIYEVDNLFERLRLDMANKEVELKQLQEKEDASRNAIDAYKKQVDTLSEQLKHKNLKFEKSKVVIKEKNIEIQRLKAELENVPESFHGEISKLHQLQEEHLQVLSVQQNERDSLQQEIDRIQILYNGIEAKVQEKSGYIETLEIENNAYKEKIIKLESCIGLFEERRKTLERHSDLLDEQLQKQTNEYERNEDALIYRLNMLLDHDDAIGKRLIETQEKKEELLDKLEQSQIEVSDLQLKLSKLEKELENFKNEKFRETVNENEILRQQLKTAQIELSRQQNVYEGRLAQKHTEIDDLENDLSIQLNKINNEKRKLLEDLEKSLDEVNELKDENVKLKESRNSLEQNRNDLEREITWIRMQNENMTQDQFELQELRMQSIHDKTDIDNLKQQLDTLIHNHEIESSGLRKQIEELDSVRLQIGQNQTDDQVFIENENRRLKEMLAEKEMAIAHYQQENLKLQMASMQRSAETSATPLPRTSHLVDLRTPGLVPKEELFTSHEIGLVGHNSEILDSTKMDKQEYNFEGLKKHASDLEEKLQEQTKRYEKTVDEYEKRLKAYEIRHGEEIRKNVELMIISDETTTNQLPSLDSFFSRPQPPVTDIDRGKPDPNDTDNRSSAIPVQEELIVPQKAYMLYPEATATTATDEGEGWSCGAEEALLEEKHHIQRLHLNPPRSTEVAEYKDRINELSLEKARSDEKIIELQIKCGKAMKKLKEYKSRVEKAELEKMSRKASSIDSCDLDMAIQDELKLQVRKLEEYIRELKKQHEKVLDEKENLLKKIDILASANTRLLDIKECQDTKIESLQVEVRQQIKKIEAMENWNAKDRRLSPAIENEHSINELSYEKGELELRLENALKEIEDSKVDKDELQALLDDEKNNAITNEMKIKELKDKIATLENAKDSKVADLEVELRKLQDILLQKEAEYQQSNVMNQNFKLQLNEYLATIKQVSLEMETLKCELENMQMKYNESVSENTRLCGDVKALQDKSNALCEEVNAWKNKGEMLTETALLSTTLEEKVIELSSQMHFKEAEIWHLKQKVQDLTQEDFTQSLMQEITMKNQEIVQLHLKLQELETEKQENDLAEKKSEADKSCLYVEQIKQCELDKDLNDLRKESRRMEAELQILNDNASSHLDMEVQLKEITLELNARNAEITQLKFALESANQQLTTMEKIIAENKEKDKIQVDIAEINRSWERTVEEKCGEIADSWRQYLEEKEMEFKKLESDLILEIEQIRAGIFVPKRKGSEGIEGDEGMESDIYLKMQAVLEQQEVEIVTLKEQLAIRSAEYARLASRHDPYALSTSSNASAESNTQRKMSNNSAVSVFGSDQTSTVPKSELDLALYMLHQRDMRCEELTLELVNLLEERDTLQLKLSNSLRQVEEIKQNLNYPESTSESDQISSNPNSPEKLMKMKTTHATDDDLRSKSLSSKLSQLQNVRYAKDKFIREEREERQRQMEKIQQDMAKIPSEAVSELIGSNLASNMQSPSNALLDWLWGKNSSS